MDGSEITGESAGGEKAGQMADEIQREKMLCYENHTQSNSQLQFTYKLNNSNLHPGNS